MTRQAGKRAYDSSTRMAAALERRERVLDRSAELLATTDGLGAFALEAVANSAGVTRLTVYHQFRSRRAFMEAVSDRAWALLKLAELGDALDQCEPEEVLLISLSRSADFGPMLR